MINNFRLYKNLLTELTILLAAALSIVISNINIYILIFSIIMHELGHIIAALLTGAKPENFTIHGFGVEISFPGKTPSAKNMLIISAGGPILSLILALIGYQANNHLLFTVNLSVALINLIPAHPLDGGNILYSILSGHVSRKKLRRLMKFSGKIFGIILSSIGILILFISTFNISLLYMGLFIFFSSDISTNPVVEITSQDYRKVEKCSVFLVDSSLSCLDVAGNLPANSIGAIRDKSGKIISFVTPLYLYNQETQKSRP